MSGFNGAIAPGILAPPYVATITTGQWSGSGDDYYITVSASNVTADSILIPHYDQPSSGYFNGPVWCVPGSGSFTIHTSAIPSDTVTILVQFVGVLGEAQYQVLADVYSTSQAVAKADIVDNLSSGEPMPPSAGCVYDAVNPIGTVYTGTGNVTSIANATNTDVLSATLPAGTYVVVRGCDFSSNATGVRRVAKDNSSASNAFANVNAVNGFDTVVQHTEIITLSVQTEIKCNVYQNSGAAMSIWPYMYAVRIK